MNPTNSSKNTCTPISSNCVIWDGPTIDCIKLCNGDSVSEAVYLLGKELCTVLDQINVSNYQLNCLPFDNCKPKDFKALIQLIITQLCAVPGVPYVPTGGLGTGTANPPAPIAPPVLTQSGFGNSIANTSECPNCIVNLAPCFQYNNPANNDLVTTGLLSDYVQLIAVRVCDLVSQIATQQAALVNLSERMQVQEQRLFPTYTLPMLFPVCVASATPAIPLDQLAALTEAKVCEILASLGAPAQIYNMIGSGTLLGLGNQPALGTSGGTVKTLPNWVVSPSSMTDSVQNMWAVVLDLRSAVANLLATCCNTTCNDIQVVFTAAMASPTTIKLYFTGDIPANFTNCVLAGSMFKIQDTSGNYVNQTVDVVGEMNNATGFTINLSGSPLNLAENLTVSSTMCFLDPVTETVCQRVVTYTIVNTLDCPSVVYTPTSDTIAYNFVWAGGALTFVMQLFDGATLVGTQSFSVTGPTTVSGVFTGLVPNTLYKARVQMSTLTQSKDCPYTNVTTTGTPCPAPQSVTATFSY
jgi:hypothetical protein